jgi:hypothetical protein
LQLILLALMFLLRSPLALATEEKRDGTANPNTVTLSEETDLGATQWNQSLNGSGAFGGREGKDPPWTWNLSYGYSRSVSNSAGNPDVIDITQNWSAGMGWTGPSGWGLNFAVDYSHTPAESLVQRGGAFTLSRSWKSEPLPSLEPIKRGEAGPEETGFASTFKLGLEAGSSSFLENYAGTANVRVKVKKKVVNATVATQGMNVLRQYHAALDANWDATAAWSFELNFKAYAYPYSVDSFEALLDSPKALSSGANSFSGTLNGLQLYTYTADIKWHFADSWTDDLNESLSVMADNHSFDSTTKNTVEWVFSDPWKMTGGLQYETSLSQNTWTGILGLEWSF